MDLVPQLTNWLSKLNMAGDVAVLAALLWRRLTRVYATIFIYFVVDLLQSFLAERLSGAYQLDAYIVGQSAKWLISVWFVLELYGSVLAPHPALAKFGRGAVGIFLAISAGLSFPGFFLGLVRRFDPSRTITLFTRFERTADSSVVVLLLIISLVLLWFPLKVRRNVASYLAGFTVYFMARVLLLFAFEYWRNLVDQINVGGLLTALLVMIFWVVVLRPEGEKKTVAGHSWNPQEASRLSAQLDDINARLDRFLRELFSRNGKR